MLRALCNLGYARGACARFPDRNAPDAVRFSIARDTGGTIYLRYAIERDHHPFTQGELECRRGTDLVFCAEPLPTLAAQARAYVTSYLARKDEARCSSTASGR